MSRVSTASLPLKTRIKTVASRNTVIAAEINRPNMTYSNSYLQADNPADDDDADNHENRRIRHHLLTQFRREQSPAVTGVHEIHQDEQGEWRSEEHTSELQSHSFISYA